jgi:hypothetical protein
MVKLSQKDILSEGFASGLRRGLARGAAAVGGALKQASDAGVRATVGDFVRGGKAGYEAEKTRQKSPETELDKAIEEFGYVRISDPRGDISDVAVIEVADLDYDESGRIQGAAYNKPLILKWDKANKTFSMVKGPKGETSSTTKPGTGSSSTSTNQVTRSNFKVHLKDFVKNNLKGQDFMSKLAVTEFVRNLAKTAGNANWYKNLPQYINKVKKDNKIFSNIELEQLINLMIQDQLMTESQKTTLRQLTLLSG